MDNSVIDYLFYSDEEMRRKIETDVEFEKIELLIDRHREKLKASFTEEQTEMFERYEDDLSDEYNVVSRIFFRMGMKVGIRVVAEGMFDS